MTTTGKSTVQVIHFLSCGKHSGSANSIAVTGTTKEVVPFLKTVMRLQSIIKDEDSKKEACQKGGPENISSISLGPC